jgi:hypothetical protein
MSLRLDKAGEYVVCGVISCGARLGARGDEGQRFVLLPGYRRDPDDVLRMPRRAVKRMRQGQYAGRVEAGLRFARRQGAGDGFMPRQPEREGRTGLGPALPARVKCWDCENVSVADAETLRVTPAATDGQIALNEVFPDNL